jgi:1-acyl-sn-glycerol-3-phosphate acyltransferase
MELVYTPVTWLVRGLLTAKRWRVAISGAEHVPAESGAVIACNHISYVDYLFVGYGALQRGRLVRFAAKQEIFEHRLAGPLMQGMGHLPVDRESRGAGFLRVAAEAAGRGELVGVFPEATISRAFVPKHAKAGPARMAIDGGVPLIPAAVWGTQRLATKGMPAGVGRFPRGVAVSVAFAPPVELSDGDPRVATDRLMQSIGALVGELQRTYPQAPSADADPWWLPAHLGGTAPTLEQTEAAAARESAERRERRAAERRACRGEPEG